MSGDFNTTITLKGTKEELMAMVNVLKTYATEKSQRYNDNHDCAYLEYVEVSDNNEDEMDVIDLTFMDDDDLDELNEMLDNPEKTIYVYAPGPYGIFGLLEEVPLFEDMAEVAPNASFDGTMSGFNTGGAQKLKGVLEKGLLHLYVKYPEADYEDFEDADEDWDEEDDTEWDEESIYNPVTKKWDK